MSTHPRALTVNGATPPAAISAGRGHREAILVVESDPEFGRAVVEQLRADGHPAELARSASEAPLRATARPPRLVVLGELDTPRGTVELLQSIRQRQPAGCNWQMTPWMEALPVIVLSARTSQPDLLRASEAGADDFVSRRAGYLELRARTQALLRRCERKPQDATLRIGPLTIDRATYAVSLHGEQVNLRRMEYELLLYLASDPNRVFRRDELLRAVWGFRSAGATRTIDSHVSRLRGKLAVRGEHWIINVWGVGYSLI